MFMSKTITFVGNLSLTRLPSNPSTEPDEDGGGSQSSGRGGRD